MDYHDFRAFYSVLMFITFIGIVIWAWSRNRKPDFDEAAHLPLNEPERPRADNNKGGTL